MGEQVVKKFRSLYGKASGVLSDWDGKQELSLALLSSAANTIQRLPAMSQRSNYGTLEDLPGVADAVLAKQMEALEGTLQRLHTQLAEFQVLCNHLEKLAGNGKQLLQGMASQDVSLRVRRGASPSLIECQEGLEELWQMHRDELAVKRALVQVVRWDSKEEELSHVQMLFRGQPNLDPATVRVLQQKLQPLE